MVENVMIGCLIGFVVAGGAVLHYEAAKASVWKRLAMIGLGWIMVTVGVLFCVGLLLVLLTSNETRKSLPAWPFMVVTAVISTILCALAYRQGKTDYSI